MSRNRKRNKRKRRRNRSRNSRSSSTHEQRLRSDEDSLKSLERPTNRRHRNRSRSRDQYRSRSSSYEHRRRRRSRDRYRKRSRRDRSKRSKSSIERETPPRSGHVSYPNDLNSDTQAIFATLVEALTNSRPQGNKFPMLGNVIPDFDPMVKSQTILMWINKVDECAKLYSWGDDQIIHYALPKLTGVAKTWYQALPSMP